MPAGAGLGEEFAYRVGGALGASSTTVTSCTSGSASRAITLERSAEGDRALERDGRDRGACARAASRYRAPAPIACRRRAASAQAVTPDGVAPSARVGGNRETSRDEHGVGHRGAANGMAGGGGGDRGSISSRAVTA